MLLQHPRDRSSAGLSPQPEPERLSRTPAALRFARPAGVHGALCCPERTWFQLRSLRLLRRTTNAGPEFFHDFRGRLPRRLLLVNIEGNCTDPGVTSATIALTHLGQVYQRRRRRPGIRADRNFNPEAALAQAHAINGFRVQIVRDEFVVTL